ncbi:sterol desaturase family protein [Polluticoccus soli]|uniref:sterol desaturase family protein n=1 Tax=Polluticoccus soli TaxID=3034150 RepID=UPI0023E1F0F3|nr:sterol desaturase family protein [Flavipsychrobacter sp. JY13-12]
MEFDKIKNKGQARLFKSDYMETMTKTHPLVIYSMYFPVIAFMLYYGAAYKGVGAGAEALMFIAGALFWSLFEYLMHRHLFHMIVESPRAKKFVYTMHGVHHEYPRDKERLFMPPVPSMVIAAVLFYLFYLALGWSALSFFPGFLFGYLMYGSMHFAIHAFAPPRFLKALWRNHHLHHYKAPDKGFGVSSVLWDVIFRTVPKQD